MDFGYVGFVGVKCTMKCTPGGFISPVRISGIWQVACVCLLS